MIRTYAALAAAILLLVPSLASAGLPVPDDWLPDPTKRPTQWVSIDILTPIADAELGGKLLIEGTAAAEKGYAVRYVTIYVDNVYMGRAEGTTNWSFALDTRTLLDGAHTFSASAFATPAATGFFLVYLGATETAKFRTLNHQLGVTLLDETIDVQGASAGAWTIPIDEDYTGLRVTLEGAGGRSLLGGPRAQLLLAYKDTPESPSLRTWLLAYGLVNGGGFISKPPHGVLKAPGVLVLDGAFAGQGTLHVKIEAVALSSLT